jgi:phosphate transport system substrate-binding protein
MQRRHVAAVAVAVAVGALLIVPITALAKTTITMSGSTSVYPLAVKLKSLYVKAYPKRAAFKIVQGGSDIGINDVSHGRFTIGNASRDRQPADPAGLSFNPIARDAVCVITNAKNKISSLSQAQIQDIFSGSNRSWSGVPGASVSGPIDIVTRTASSGTADAFQSIFMGQSRRVAANAAAKSSNGLVQQTIASDPNAIGFVSLDFVNGVNPVGYKGVACNLRNAKSGQYGGVRTFYMVTKGKPKGATATFLKWVTTSPAARRAISSDWIPLAH